MEDLSGLTLRELLTLARERLGAAASGLKTRAELLAALGGDEVKIANPVHPERSQGIVTRDFFRRRSE